METLPFSVSRAIAEVVQRYTFYESKNRQYCEPMIVRLIPGLVLQGIVVMVCFAGLSAQSSIVLEETLVWEAEPVRWQIAPEEYIQAYWFQGDACAIDPSGMPIYTKTVPFDGPGRLECVLERLEYEQIEPLEGRKGIEPPMTHEVTGSVAGARGKWQGSVSLSPIIRNESGGWSRLVSFTLRVRHLPESPVVGSRGGPTTTDESVLASGVVYKLEIAESGIHKLTYSYLRDVLGINVDEIDPRRLSIYGNGGGILPRLAGASRFDDLVENPILVVGEEDGRFDQEDYVLWYAEQADVWRYNASADRFDMVQNPFSDLNACFLKIGTTPGKRLELSPDLSPTAPPDVYQTDAFDDFLRLEDERSNLLYDFGSAEGSGQEWFGDGFRVTRTRTYSDFDFPGLIQSEPVNVVARFAGRSAVPTVFSVIAGGEEFSASIPGTDVANNVTAAYARIREAGGNFFASEERIPITVAYPQGGAASEGWLDFIQLNARCALRLRGAQLSFRDSRAAGQPLAEYSVEGANGMVQVWDITNPLNPRKQEFIQSGSRLTFTASSDTLHTYVIFDLQGDFPQPVSGIQLSNQNLHGLPDADMLIVYHPDFEQAVQQLAAHRRTHSRLSVALAPIEQVYNEFSSGRQDPTAIRDLARLMYQRNPEFRYLLLFGDGSFDYRNRLGLEPGQRHHFIPTYETVESMNPLYAYPSDDYFGLLDDDEGDGLESGRLDLAIGRLPVKTPLEAGQFVQRIIDYETSPEYLRDWRNRIVFISDDEDNNLHLNANENVEERLEAYPFFNIDKVYFDAYPEQSTSGGDRYPDANNAINTNMFRGALIMNYMGHGGPTGWAQERVLTLDDIDGWTNRPRLPLLITATCSFTGFDEPNFVSGGERTVLNDRGGAVALMSTVRAVFAQSNEILVKNVFDHLFDKEADGPLVPIGEALRRGTNDTQGTTTRIINSRKFTLIGDPAMRLGLPKLRVETSSINGRPVGSGSSDTLRALSKVTIEGFVADEFGQQLSNFNGRMYVSVFDKADTLQTLGQGAGVTSFRLQRNVLFKGVATVSNGQFSLNFVLPKDIDYTFGPGKLSYYAENGISDATGYYDGFLIGGTDPDGLTDDKGPLVEVFMDDEQFVFGGLTGENPLLLVKLSDENGINISASSIGHDMTGVLDDRQAERFRLNDFYESALDDFTRGTVRYPLNKLEEGLHTVRVKAWDVANNPSEGYTEFVVASSASVALDHVLNYPNPFTTNTWFEFEHNAAGLPLDVRVDIFTISGRLVKSLERQILPLGARVTRQDGIQWDGTDDFGDQLARGVYLYRVSVRSMGSAGQAREAESEFEKLVILR
jgi:hypothetical protein